MIKIAATKDAKSVAADKHRVSDTEGPFSSLPIRRIQFAGIFFGRAGNTDATARTARTTDKVFGQVAEQNLSGFTKRESSREQSAQNAPVKTGRVDFASHLLASRPTASAQTIDEARKGDDLLDDESTQDDRAKAAVRRLGSWLLLFRKSIRFRR